MKNTNQVLKETGLTYPMLNRLKELGILPKPVRRGLGRRKGVIGEFEDEVIDIINQVKLHQKRGLTLSEIAELPKEKSSDIEFLKPKEEYLIPLKADAMKSYLDAYGDLHNWLQKQIEQQAPGYELYGVDTEKVTRKGKEFLRPRIIKVKPKAGVKRG